MRYTLGSTQKILFTLLLMLRNLRDFFTKKKGSATGISMGFSAGIFLVAAGTVSFVGNTQKENAELEGATVSYYAAERGLENALLEVYGHLPGHEVEDSKLRSSEKEAVSVFTVSSRSQETEGVITLPAPGNGNSKQNNEWNTLPQGEPISIPLYIDNTGRN